MQRSAARAKLVVGNDPVTRLQPATLPERRALSMAHYGTGRQRKIVLLVAWRSG